MSSKTQPKVAIVCDWLTIVGGAERVLLAIHELYPDAPIYTSQYSEKGIDWFKDADIHTGWLQRFPTRLRRYISPLRQIYFSHLDLSDYDLVISVTGAEAKSVRTGKNTTHICYCHVPTQYYWQLYDDYIKNPGFGFLNPLARIGLKIFARPMRRRDFKAAQNVDYFVTISDYAKSSIKKYYKREAYVINPPVNVQKFSTTPADFSTYKEIKNADCQISKQHNLSKSQENEQIFFTTFNGKSQGSTPVKRPKKHGFITTSRQVTWKRLDLCVQACLKTNTPLTIIGEGPEHAYLESLADGSPLIKFLPRMSQEGINFYLHQSEGFLFPSFEPFGIAPVEALAAGCPVIAYSKGGAREYIKPGKNGVLFNKQTPDSLAAAIRKFKKMKFSPTFVKKSAQPFDEPKFKQKFQTFVEEKLKND